MLLHCFFCFKSVDSQIIFLVLVTIFFIVYLDSIYITNVSELYHSRDTLHYEPTPQDQSLTKWSIKLTSHDQFLTKGSIKLTSQDYSINSNFQLLHI
jgi:hypothetical protein